MFVSLGWCVLGLGVSSLYYFGVGVVFVDCWWWFGVWFSGFWICWLNGFVIWIFGALCGFGFWM